MDVTSLYTIIPHQAGIKAVCDTLLQSTEYHGPPISFLGDLLQLPLTSNFFKFENKYYIQKTGTSMGAAMAPTYANIYMHTYEQEHILSPFGNMIAYYTRFVDDIFMIWQSDFATLQQMVTHLNSIDSPVRLTMQADKYKIQFLDIELYRTNTSLGYTLFRKPTDRNTLLHASSFHPRSMKKSLPFSQFLRVIRNNSDHITCQKQLMEMSIRFHDRGYSKAVLQQSLLKATQYNKSVATVKATQQRVVFSTKFHTASHHVRRIVKKKLEHHPE
ncbi:uncharacterized protein RCH25_038735 [Pelodytes ibericus]